jgi:spore coat protein U-like protein
MNPRRLLLLAGAVLVLALFQHRAEAQASCTITTNTNVAFGTYNVYGAAPLDTTGQVTIRCNRTANPVTVDLSRGHAPSFTPRYMLNGTQQLNYNLYRDALRTIIWGDGTNGSSHYGPVNPPNNQNVPLTIYARIPAGQDVGTGTYTDSITATVNF